MKILLISYELPDIDRIRGWDTWCTYFLDKAFRNKGHEVINICFRKDNPIPDIPNIDFIICITRLNYLITNFGMDLINKLKKKSNNKICTYGDIINSNNIGQFTFSVLSGEDSIKDKYYKCWWCGDQEYLYPEQDPSKFYILLDHIHYSSDKYDFVYRSYRKALKDLSKKYPIEVKIIADPNVVDFDLEKEKTYPYTRSRNKWLSIIPFYRQTHIYCVTHLELGGLSVMETGWCGASVIIPDNYICNKLSSEVKSQRCIADNWKSVRNAIEKAIVDWDVEKNLAIARAKTWDDIVDKIVEVMK